jgi:hypothetical protein
VCHRVIHSAIPRCAYTVYLCVLYGSENKNSENFPAYLLVLLPKRSVFTERYGLDLYIQFRLFIALKALRYRQEAFANCNPNS